MKLFSLVKKELPREVQKWIDNKIINKDQGDRILGLYGLELADQARANAGYYVLLTLAAAFLGISVIVLISHNWSEIPRMVRMLMMFFLTVGAHGAGIYYLLKNNEKAANVWFFLGCIAFGASIFLIAQIYHLDEHYPDGIFYWAVGIILFFIITESTAIGVLSLIVSLVWMNTEIVLDIFPLYYPLFLAPVAWHISVRKHSKALFVLMLLFFIYFAFLSTGFLLHDYGFDIDDSPEMLYQLIGLLALLSAGGIFMEASENGWIRSYGSLMFKYPFFIFIILAFFLSYDDIWRSLRHENYNILFLVWWSTIIFLLTAGLITADKLIHKTQWKNLLMNYAPIVIMLFLFIILGGFMMKVYEIRKGVNYPDMDVTLYQIFTNASLILAGIWMIIEGVRKSVGSVYYFGVITLLTTALMRYFDLIDNYITGSLIFFAAAMAIFGAAKWWKKHQDARYKNLNSEANP